MLPMGRSASRPWTYITGPLYSCFVFELAILSLFWTTIQWYGVVRGHRTLLRKIPLRHTSQHSGHVHTMHQWTDTMSCNKSTSHSSSHNSRLPVFFWDWNNSYGGRTLKIVWALTSHYFWLPQAKDKWHIMLGHDLKDKKRWKQPNAMHAQCRQMERPLKLTSVLTSLMLPTSLLCSPMVVLSC